MHQPFDDSFLRFKVAAITFLLGPFFAAGPLGASFCDAVE